MSSFQALRVHQGPSGRFGRLESVRLEELTPGDVVIRVAYSCLNYKDALAVTGKGTIARGYPRTAGIDLSGVVEASSDPAYRPGDRVLATGANLGESLDGGLAERARLPAAALVPLPQGLSLSALRVSRPRWRCGGCSIITRSRSAAPSPSPARRGASAGSRSGS
jgi:acrylyl-CoA reductase (NADPH)